MQRILKADKKKNTKSWIIQLTNVNTTSQQLSIGERYSLDKVFHQLQAKILQARWIMTLAVKAHPVESCNQKARFLRQ